MQRMTVTVDDDLHEQFETFMVRHGYSNRSEAFRDLLRDRLERERLEESGSQACVGCLTYVYSHTERELPRRLVTAQHAHHDLGVTTLHVHLDHDTCLEATILRGRTADVTGFAKSVMAERGVRHGSLWVVPVDIDVGQHAHGDASGQPHVHTRPRT